MRRPLKPFVTEYKGTNRRPKDGAGLFGAETSTPETPTRKTTKSVEAKTTTSRATERRGDVQRPNETPRYNNGSQPEDSYEAAMRAADALFSGTPAKSAAAQASSAAHDVFSRKEDAPPPESQTAPGGTGRILRVLDEEPDTTLLEMEAERAPKRRGRKPGSKNKPKVSSLGPSLDPIAEPVYAYESGHDLGDDAIVRPAAAGIVFFPAIASRGDERFAWVRRKLRPGEAWKRRLPKVIW